MFKYAKIINEKTKQCEVGLGTNVDYYKSIGMTEIEVEQAYDGLWYVKGYVPVKPAPTKEEQKHAREVAYTLKVDPITCNINRLRDEEQTEEIVAKITELKELREHKVQEIKEKYPYPEDILIN